MGNKIDDEKKKGYIYKLCIDENDKEFYIGSTQRRLLNRLWEHRYDIKKQRHSKKKTDFFLENIDKLKIILIEEIDCTKKDLKFRERYYIEKLNSMVNHLCPIRNEDEIKTYNKLYYSMNKKSIVERRQEKVKCDKCNCYLTRQYLPLHKKTLKCLINSQCLID
jgi:hypothetical protein